MMTKDEILVQAEQYAKESTCGLSYIKGYPLTKDDILGFLEIFHAWQATARVIYEEDGTSPNPDLLFASVYRDFTDFIESDIPLNPDLCAKIILEYTANRFSALYIMKNDLNSINEMENAQSMIRRLMDEQRWQELQRMTEIDNKICQEN